MKTKLLSAVVGVALCALALPGAALADPKGDAIAKRYYDLKKPDDTRAPGSVMTLIDKAGARKIWVSLRATDMDTQHYYMKVLGGQIMSRFV